jgi:hypothetical protein
MWRRVEHLHAITCDQHLSTTNKLDDHLERRGHFDDKQLRYYQSLAQIHQTHEFICQQI